VGRVPDRGSHSVLRGAIREEEFVRYVASRVGVWGRMARCLIDGRSHCVINTCMNTMYNAASKDACKNKDSSRMHAFPCTSPNSRRTSSRTTHPYRFPISLRHTDDYSTLLSRSLVHNSLAQLTSPLLILLLLLLVVIGQYTRII
jgi:hypothetical protein